MFVQEETPESFWSVFNEGLNPTRDASSFPKVCTGWFAQDHLEIIKDSLTGKREEWSVPFVVELQVAFGVSVAKGVIRIYQDDYRISYFIDLLSCHDANAPYATKDIFGRYQISHSDLDAFREQRHRRYNPEDED